MSERQDRLPGAPREHANTGVQQGARQGKPAAVNVAELASYASASDRAPPVLASRLGVRGVPPRR